MIETIQMGTCILRIMGDDLDPDAALQGSRLNPYTKFRMGLPQVYSTRVSPTSGFACEVGHGTLQDQINDAISFLEIHKHEIASIVERIDVESAYLDFVSEYDLNDASIPYQKDYLPTNLLRLSGEAGLGICLSLMRVTGESSDPASG